MEEGDLVVGHEGRRGREGVRRCFKFWSRLKKQKVYGDARKAARAAYNTAKKHAKRVVWLAKQDAGETVYANVDHKGPEIHRMAKQMRRQNQDICGEMPVRNNQGELCLDDSERMKAWVEHYKGLLNVEFPWDEGTLPDAPPVEGPPPPITNEMVTKALAKMKSGKAAGPSGIIVEMLKASGIKGIVFLRELTKSVVKHGKIPEDWEMSFILNLYKGKGDALNRGNYRGLKLTEHVMKVMERIVDEMIQEMKAIDEMQFAFVPGRGTTDAIYIIRQLQEKFLSKKDLNDKNLTLFFAFVDLEKAFDRVPRKVLWWAMRKVGVEEWIVRLVQAMYNNARSRVGVGSEYSEEFEVGVGVHQGSVLSPLLFIIVLEALSRDFRVGVPWELFFADDLVIIATSLEECVEHVKAWKEGLESKGLHVNMTKTKFMASGLGLDILQDSGKFPCAVCRTGVGRSSIRCSKCNLWVHYKKCSGLKTLSEDLSYECPPVVVCRVYALSMAALSRRLRLVTVCSRWLIVSATWVTCSVLVAVVLLLPLPGLSMPGVSSEKTFLCSHPSLCLSTWGVVCLALMYVVQCYMVRKLGPWLPPPFTVCAVTIVLWSAGSVGSNRRMTHQWTNCMPN